VPRVTFANDDLTIELPAGSSLPLAVQEAGASLPFGCRAGTCGTCVLHVVSGGEGLEEPGFVEEDTLQVVGVHDETARLGCQIVLRETDLVVAWDG